MYQEGTNVADQDADLCGIIAVLAKYQGHSLIHLDVTDNEDELWADVETSPFPGFKAFQKLRALRTELDMFTIRRSDEGPYRGELKESMQIWDDLPTTLEHFTVACASYLPTDPIYDVLGRLVNAKQTYTPQLRKLSVLNLKHRDSDSWMGAAQVLDQPDVVARLEKKNALAAACERHGVEYECPVLS